LIPARRQSATDIAVSCVIVAFHRPDALSELLSVLADRRIQLIVADVEDDPRIRAIAVAHDATVVDVPGNPGYAAAVNAGVRQASHEVVVFLNDDVRLTTDGALRLAEVVQSGEADVAVPRLKGLDGTTERSIAALPTPSALAIEWMALPDNPIPGLRKLLRVQKWRLPECREPIHAAAATVVACRRSLLEDLPLPEVYFLYWEESEWFCGLSRRKARVVYEPSVEALHVGGRADVRPDKSRLLARNAVRCVRRTQGRPAATAAWLIVISWNFRLAAVDCIRTVLRRDHFPTAASRLSGLVAACRAVQELR
jgi:GT2 family glycosyltransferase